MAVDMPAIDADGHICERAADVRRYLEPPWDRRQTGLVPVEQPWDNRLFGTLGQQGIHDPLDPAEEIATWLRIMDEHGMDYAVLFPTQMGAISHLREPEYAASLARACNNLFAKEFNCHSPRAQVVGVLPMQDPVEAARELRRSVTELGLISFEILSAGLPLGLGDKTYDPVYAAALELGVPLCIHGTRNASASVGGAVFKTFAETHCYAFPASMLQQFTSVMWNGVPVRFPGLKLAFLEIGATWLPYYLDRLDEHWEKRGEFEAPHLPRKPSAVFRESAIYVSLEAEEGLLAETVDYVGDRHFLYASDVPHWDNEFPDNLDALRAHPKLSRESKERILSGNARELFGLGTREPAPA